MLLERVSVCVRRLTRRARRIVQSAPAQPPAVPARRNSQGEAAALDCGSVRSAAATSGPPATGPPADAPAPVAALQSHTAGAVRDPAPPADVAGSVAVTAAPAGAAPAVITAPSKAQTTEQRRLFAQARPRSQYFTVPPDVADDTGHAEALNRDAISDSGDSPQLLRRALGASGTPGQRMGTRRVDAAICAGAHVLPSSPPAAPQRAQRRRASCNAVRRHRPSRTRHRHFSHRSARSPERIRMPQSQLPKHPLRQRPARRAPSPGSPLTSPQSRLTCNRDW